MTVLYGSGRLAGVGRSLTGFRRERALGLISSAHTDRETCEQGSPGTSDASRLGVLARCVAGGGGVRSGTTLAMSSASPTPGGLAVSQNELLVLLTRNSAHAYALSMSGRYRNLIDRDDILAAADLGLLRGAKSYQPDKASFSAWVFFWIRREVRRLIGREVNWHTRVAACEPDEVLSGDDQHALAELLELSRHLDAETQRLLAERLSAHRLATVPGLEGLTPSQARRRLRSLREAMTGEPKRKRPGRPSSH